jgi:tripartite-type tricarboxylate transporter receptor subunit TctC
VKNPVMCRARGLLSVLMLLAASATFAAWPADQTIKIVVPQAPGGTNDTVARLIGVELGKALQQTVVIENRAGAGGAIGMQAVARASADGYTFGLASDSTALLDVIRPQLGWKMARDLRAVGLIGEQPISVAVSAKSPYKTFAEVVAAAKAKPGSVAYGTSGTGTVQHLVGAWLAKLADIQLDHIPYKGGGQAATDLVGGQVPMAVLGLAPMLAQAKSGSVIIVGVTTPKRAAALPSVPTLAELGYPQVALSQWAGLVAPTATPEPIVKAVAEALAKILADDSVRQRLAESGIDTKPMAHTEFDVFLKNYIETWARVLPSLNLKLD